MVQIVTRAGLHGAVCSSVRSTEMSRAGTLARLVSELIYIPIYDVALPEDGVQAVLELVVSADAEENQIVGNVISYVSNILDELQVCTLWCLWGSPAQSCCLAWYPKPACFSWPRGGSAMENSLTLH